MTTDPMVDESDPDGTGPRPPDVVMYCSPCADLIPIRFAEAECPVCGSEDTAVYTPIH